MARRQKNKIVLIICSIVLAAMLGVGIYFGAKAIYNNGVQEGRWLAVEEVSDRVKALGVAVSEKVNFQKSISELFADAPKEMNTEAIDAYIAKLEELAGKAEVENVEAILQDYLGKWRTFKETYVSENNGQIEEAFNGLKSAAEDTAKQIKSQYDEAVKKAVQEL